jgi:hypothetical protein
MDHDDDVARLQRIDILYSFVIDSRRLLHLEIVIAAAERTHFVALAFLRLLGNILRSCAAHLAMFLDPREVRRSAPAALYGPARTAGEHRFHFGSVEPNRAGAAHARRNALIKRLGELGLNREYVIAPDCGISHSYSERRLSRLMSMT